MLIECLGVKDQIDNESILNRIKATRSFFLLDHFDFQNHNLASKASKIRWKKEKIELPFIDISVISQEVL